MSLGERITKLRKEQNISQGQLAEAMEVSRQAVSKWENDLSTPDPAKMIRLADVLDTDLEYLTSGRIVVPSRLPVVLETVKTVEKVVEKPVIQEVERIVERKVEVPVEVPVVKYIEKPVIRRKVRTQYVRKPIEYVIVGVLCFLTGFLLGVIL